MRRNTIIRKTFWNTALAGGMALLLAGTPGLAQSPKVARDSLKFDPDPATKKLAVGFRMVDELNVIPVQAVADGKAENLELSWEAWVGDKAPACAWMIVVDTSNLERKKTVAKCVDEVRSLMAALPKQDKVAVYTLGLDLVEAVPFAGTPEERVKGLAGIKPAGDVSMATLIYSNLRNGLGRLAELKEPQKAVLLMTDGKDETPGGAPAWEIEKKKLIDAAKSAGIVIHTLGYAESARDLPSLGGVQDISKSTEGMFRQAAVDTKELPTGTLSLLSGVMHGAGTVRIDVSKLTEPAALTVTVKNAAGKTAVLQVPRDEVAKAMGASPADIEAARVKKEKEDKDAADKNDADGKKAAADKLAEDKKLADKTAADKVAKDKEESDREAAKKKKILIGVGSCVAVLVVVVVLLMVRASRKRAAEEEARLAEEERAARGARRQAEETKKPEAPALAWLEMCDAQQTRHPVRIPSLKIGRGQHNDLTLRNDSISGNHCVLNCNREKEWSITDLNSGNGVVLNGERVVQASLRHGDVIELGELKMRFLLHA